MITKEDYKYFIWNTLDEVFFREKRFAGVVGDVDLSTFLPLTEETLLLVCMVHPSISKSELQEAIEDWDLFEIDDTRHRFIWIPGKPGWG